MGYSWGSVILGTHGVLMGYSWGSVILRGTHGYSWGTHGVLMGYSWGSGGKLRGHCQGTLRAVAGYRRGSGGVVEGYARVLPGFSGGTLEVLNDGGGVLAGTRRVIRVYRALLEEYSAGHWARSVYIHAFLRDV
jgi:hypothetical protein